MSFDQSAIQVTVTSPLSSPISTCFLQPHFNDITFRSSVATSSKLKRRQTSDSHFTVKSLKDEGGFSDSKTWANFSHLQNLISECSSLQASVCSLKAEASTTLTGSKDNFTKLMEETLHTSPERFYETEAYRQGKVMIAERTKAQLAQSESKQLKLVKSLIQLKDPKTKAKASDAAKPLLHMFIKPQDLSKRKTSQLITLNRRKFGEAYPSTLKLLKEKPHRPRLPSKYRNLDEDLRQDIIDHDKLKVDHPVPKVKSKSPPKTRLLLASEQELLFEQMEQMTPLNQLILNSFQKYKPTYVSQLRYKRNRALNKRIDQVKSNSYLPSRPSTKARPQTHECRRNLSTVHVAKRSEDLREMRGQVYSQGFRRRQASEFSATMLA